MPLPGIKVDVFVVSFFPILINTFVGVRSTNVGIGYLISVASQTFNTANLFAGVAIFAVAGLILTELLQRAEAVLAPWRATT